MRSLISEKFVGAHRFSIKLGEILNYHVHHDCNDDDDDCNSNIYVLHNLQLALRHNLHRHVIYKYLHCHYFPKPVQHRDNVLFHIFSKK